MPQSCFTEVYKEKEKKKKKKKLVKTGTKVFCCCCCCASSKSFTVYLAILLFVLGINENCIFGRNTVFAPSETRIWQHDGTVCSLIALVSLSPGLSPHPGFFWVLQFLIVPMCDRVCMVIVMDWHPRLYSCLTASVPGLATNPTWPAKFLPTMKESAIPLATWWGEEYVMVS